MAEKLRDIDNDIAASRPDTLEARLAVIDNKIADRKAELERMLREADKLGQSDAAKGEIQRGLDALPALQQAQAQATTQEFYEQRINDLLQQRQASMDAINTLQEAGLLTSSEAAARIEEVNARLLPQLEALRAKAAEFMATLGDGPQAQAARASLENLSAQIEAMSVELSAQKRQVIDVFVNGFGQAFMETATLIADTLKGVQDAGDAWKAFGDIVLNTIADILIQLAQMIIQQAIFNALKAAENSGGGWGRGGRNAPGALPAGAGLRGRSTLETLFWSVVTSAEAEAASHPCSVLTPIPSPCAFIACTAAIAPAAVVK